LVAKLEWLETDMVDAFIFSYANTQNYMNDKPTTEIGALEATLDTFKYNGLISERFTYEKVRAILPKN
jgi:hypothetical protein